MPGWGRRTAQDALAETGLALCSAAPDRLSHLTEVRLDGLASAPSSAATTSSATNRHSATSGPVQTKIIICTAKPLDRSSAPAKLFK
jgi:hypothetical protein